MLMFKVICAAAPTYQHDIGDVPDLDVHSGDSDKVG